MERVVLGREGGERRVRVFVEELVTDVVVGLDRPLAAVPGEKLLWGGSLRRREGDAAGLLDTGFACAVVPRVDSLAGDAEDLRDIGMVDQARKRGQGSDASLLDAATGTGDISLKRPVPSRSRLIGYEGLHVSGALSPIVTR